MTFSKLVKVLQVQGQFFIWRSQNIFLKSSTMKLPTLKNIFPWFGGLLTEIEGWKSFSPPATFGLLKIGVVSENEKLLLDVRQELTMILCTEFCEDPEAGKKVMPPPYPKTVLVNKRSRSRSRSRSIPSTTFPDLIHLVTKFGSEIL